MTVPHLLHILCNSRNHTSGEEVWNIRALISLYTWSGQHVGLDALRVYMYKELSDSMCMTLLQQSLLTKWSKKLMQLRDCISACAISIH